MPFNINDFHSNIAKTGGFAMLTDFEVTMPNRVGKNKNNILSNSISENLKYRISSIDMPARAITFSDYRDYGVPYKIATGVNYIDITMNVMMSPDYRERDYFLTWQDYMIGRNRNPNLSIDELSTQWDIGYYNDYVSTITIKFYLGQSSSAAGNGGILSNLQNATSIFTGNQPSSGSGEAKLVYEVELVDAFPALVGNLSANWSTPEISTIPITINYRSFKDRMYGQEGFETQRRTGIFERLNQVGLGGAIGSGAGALVGRAGRAGQLGSSAAFGASSIVSRI